MDLPDRRSNKRYPISLEIEYKVPDGNGGQRKGFGRTIDIASRGLLLDISPPLLNRGPIELSISWPFLLDGAIRMKLLMYGEIVRVSGSRIGVRVIGHTFQTAGRATQQAQPTLGSCGPRAS